MKCKVTARAKVSPTEELDKVIKAISNVLDYDELEIGDGYVDVTGDEDSLLKFREALKNRKIRDTAQKIFFKGVDDHKIKFSLSKQTALVHIPNFVEPGMSALGEIDIEIETEDVDRFIEWMTYKKSEENI